MSLNEKFDNRALRQGENVEQFLRAEDWNAVIKHVRGYINVQEPPYNAVGDGVTDDTAAIQASITACPTHGTVVLPPATYLTDTLTAKSDCTIDMRGATLSFKAHTTTHNPVIRVGTLSAAVSRVRILGGKIDGNAAGQTFAGEEWSPGIMVWGSDYNTIEGVEITDTAGDGITIGYDSGRLVGSNGNHVIGCEVYDVISSPSRQAIAITWGSENVIRGNRVSGNIDVEIDASVGEAKNNIIEGNSGRTQAEGLTSPRKSDLQILLATLNTDPTRTSGNRIIGNSAKYIGLQYDKASVLSGNHVVGSDATQGRLVSVDGSDDTIITGNTLVANAAVATSLTEVLRTRGGSGLVVTDNLADNGAITFHGYTATFAASTAAKHHFRGNVLTGTGSYRNGGAERASEWALYRLDVAAGAETLTQLAGVPVTTGGVVSSADNFVLTAFGNAGTKIQLRVWPQCSVTAANASTLDAWCVAKEVISASNHTVTLYSASMAAGAVTLAAFAGSTGTGTFFFEVWF